MNAYAKVTYDRKTGHIEGLTNMGRGKPHILFSATISLFAISQAMDLEPNSIGRFMDIADGYGEPGFFPCGYDWSGIRDSSESSVAKMFQRAKEILYVRRLALAEIGLPATLIKDLYNTKPAPRNQIVRKK